MRLIVKKFGGTSVGDLERIKNVALLIQRFVNENPDAHVIAVASAMSGETDRLIKLGKGISDQPDPRELDALVSTGEQQSTALLAMALNSLGIKAKSMTAIQAGINTDSRHTNAQILEIAGERLKTICSDGIIPVIAGFQGVTDAGDLTTLGRGGSDTTAVAVAAAVSAERCYIYTDVEGVYSADPRICQKAQFIKRISHEEMLELAALGAKVLHPRSVDFALRYQVPLVVLSTFKPGPGSWIVNDEEIMEKAIVSGITHRNDEAKITIAHIQGGIKAVSRVFDQLAREGIFIDMITQTGVVADKTNISFTFPEDQCSKVMQVVDKLVPELKSDNVTIDREIAKVSAVGLGMRSHTGIAAQMFTVLAEEGIDVSMISTSEIKISVIVPRKYSEVAVRALHEAFIETQPTISVEK